jgi:hypothetical protein
MRYDLSRLGLGRILVAKAPELNDGDVVSGCGAVEAHRHRLDVLCEQAAVLAPLLEGGAQQTRAVDLKLSDQSPPRDEELPVKFTPQLAQKVVVPSKPPASACTDARLCSVFFLNCSPNFKMFAGFSNVPQIITCSPNCQTFAEFSNVPRIFRCSLNLQDVP